MKCNIPLWKQCKFHIHNNNNSIINLSFTSVSKYKKPKRKKIYTNIFNNNYGNNINDNSKYITKFIPNKFFPYNSNSSNVFYN